MATANPSIPDPQNPPPITIASHPSNHPPDPPPRPTPPEPEPPPTVNLPDPPNPTPTLVANSDLQNPPPKFVTFQLPNQLLEPPPRSTPPTPEPPPSANTSDPTVPPPPLNATTDPLPQQKWSTLFSAKPKNAGNYEVNDIVLKFEGENLVVTDDIVQASVEQWSGYLVGFFLDTPLPYTTVINYLKYHWRAQGTIEFKSNGTVFFFQFSSLADRIRVLEADPVIIRNKLFIVKQWEPSLSNVANSVIAVPVWIKMFNIPPVAWSKRGISYMATRVGKFLCMDSNTESLSRLEFAKCMVEVTANSPLPDTFPVRNLDGSIQLVKVYYLWKPELCTQCKVFGHSTVKCKIQEDKESMETDKAAGNRVITSKQQMVQVKTKESRTIVPFSEKNDRPRGVLQRSRNATVNKDNTWTRVVKRKNPVRFIASGKEKGKQVLVDASPPAVNAIGTSNRFTLLPVCDEVGSSYKINYEKEDGEIENECMEDNGKNVNNGGDVNIVNENKYEKQWITESTQVEIRKDDIKMKETNASHIAQVDEILSATFGTPKEKEKERPTEGGNLMSFALPEEMQSRENTDERNHNINSVDKHCRDTAPQKTSEHITTSNSVKQIQEHKTALSPIETARTAHIRTIDADIMTISRALQAELAQREVNSPEFLETEKKVENFNTFCSGIVYDQLHTAQLDYVSAVLQKTIASGKKKMRKSPTVKEKATNPYSHIAPPAAYRERPPDNTTEQMNSNSTEKAGPKNHITRSVKKEMLRNFQENG